MKEKQTITVSKDVQGSEGVQGSEARGKLTGVQTGTNKKRKRLGMINNECYMYV